MSRMVWFGCKLDIRSRLASRLKLVIDHTLQRIKVPDVNIIFWMKGTTTVHKRLALLKC